MKNFEASFWKWVGIIVISISVGYAWRMVQMQPKESKPLVFIIKNCSGYDYIETKKVLVTAYSNDNISIDVPEWRDGYTASMTIAKKYTIAADWKHYPVGTKIYVPEYGMGTVEDKGGLIKGENIIDIFLPTRQKALEWGVQEKEIVVFKEKGLEC